MNPLLFCELCTPLLFLSALSLPLPLTHLLSFSPAGMARRPPAPLLAALIVASALALSAVLLLGDQRPGVLLEDDDLSEAELAGRLGHAIDAHEKCRRHWPHLEKLEAAQEIRVHDARNNLEVSNRAMERARKELRDAEGLVLAARQEHQSYEAQRVAFQSFKSDYDQRTLAMKETEPTVQLGQRESEATALTPSVQSDSDSQLQAQASQLQQAQLQAMELESHAIAELRARNAAELAASQPASQPARTQDLVQVPGPMAILTKVRRGIVVPENSELARKKAVRKANVATANQAASLIAEESRLKADEIKAFAELPSEEKMAEDITRNLARQRRRENMEQSRMLITRRRVRYLERREADDVLAGMARKVQLARAQKALAGVNFSITEHKLAQEKKELATLKGEERAGPTDSEKLSSINDSLRNLRRQRHAALAGNMARETELVQVDQDSLVRGSRGRTARDKGVVKPAAKQESRAQLRKEVNTSRKELKSIRNQLLAVQGRLSQQQQASPTATATVKQTLSTSRHHDVKNDHQVLRDSQFQPTMALYNVYEEKLTGLREERKKADGLLAKAERMLNIARIDSLHASKTKKAALEELKYATSKLRRYQDLRSKSQHCQMDAVSVSPLSFALLTLPSSFCFPPFVLHPRAQSECVYCICRLVD